MDPQPQHVLVEDYVSATASGNGGEGIPPPAAPSSAKTASNCSLLLSTSSRTPITYFPLLSLPESVINEVLSFFPAASLLARTSVTSKYVHKFVHDFAERTFRAHVESRPHGPHECPRTWPCCLYSTPLEASSYIERLESMYSDSEAILTPGNEVWVYAHTSEPPNFNGPLWRLQQGDADEPSDVEIVRKAVQQTMESCGTTTDQQTVGANSVREREVPFRHYARVGGCSGGSTSWIIGEDVPSEARRKFCDVFYSDGDAGGFRSDMRGSLAAARPLIMNRLEVLLIEGGKFKAPDLHNPHDQQPVVAFRTYISCHCDSCFKEVLPGEFCDTCQFYDRPGRTYNSDPERARQWKMNGRIRDHERRPVTEFLLLSSPKKDASVLGRAKLGWENYDAGEDLFEAGGPTLESIEGVPRQYKSQISECRWTTLLDYVIKWVALMFPLQVQLQIHTRVWSHQLLEEGDSADGLELMKERGFVNTIAESWLPSCYSLFLGKNEMQEN